MFRSDYLGAHRRKVGAGDRLEVDASSGRLGKSTSSMKTTVCPRHAERGRRDAGTAVR